MGARTLSASGRELFTIDKFRDTGRPLLEVLADPDSIFIKGLAKFERRTLYANIVNDRSAVYYTTGIAKSDPFTHLDRVKLNYLEGYEDVILDPETPVAPLDPQVIVFDYGRECSADVSLGVRYHSLCLVPEEKSNVRSLVHFGLHFLTSSQHYRSYPFPDSHDLVHSSWSRRILD